MKPQPTFFASPVAKTTGEGDHRPKSRWWMRRASSNRPASFVIAVTDDVPAALPLHHALFGARSPSPIRSRSWVRRGARALVGLVLAAFAVPAFAQSKDPPSWTKPTAPFRVIGNVWYVGTEGLSSWLIRTPKGAILLDGGMPENAPLIEANLKALGVPLSDVKVLLNSHAHFDHAGGLARLRADTGARLVVGAGDKAALEAGNYPGAEDRRDLDFPPVKVDRTVRDGETVALGGVVLTAHAEPGHSAGCTGWSLPVTETGKRHTVFFDCSTSVALNRLVDRPMFPGIVQAYGSTFAKLKTIKADVFLAPHAEIFDLAGKRAKIAPGAPNPFVVPGELQAYVARSQAGFEAALAKQTAAAGAKP
jgi:metallo-beta-lactamase class B